MTHTTKVEGRSRWQRLLLAGLVAMGLLTAAACTQQPTVTVKKFVIGASAEPASMDVTTSPSAADRKSVV